MLYAIWLVGVLAAIFVSAKITKNQESLGKFEE